MTNPEFSDAFTTLLNSYAAQTSFGEDVSSKNIVLDEYEKSLYLTQAQEDLVISLYSGKSATGYSFDETEELKRYLAELIVEKECDAAEASSVIGIDSKSKFYELPKDCWYITYEAVKTADHKCGEGFVVEVVPVSQNEYHKIKRNPFRGTNNRRALRLDLANNIVEIVSKYDNLSSYYIRYLRKPSPIILEKLPDGLTIDNLNEETPCYLHEALHQTILENAVRKALLSKGLVSNNK